MLCRLTGADRFGRRLPVCGPNRPEKQGFVGLFYFLWLGQQNQKSVYDITDILRRDTQEALLDTASEAYPNVDTYFFNEPLFGYYNMADPWVLRKHVELLIAADIDFLAFDVTNGIYYDQVWPLLLALLEEYRTAGWKAPQFVFFTNSHSQQTVRHFYDAIYGRNLYPELWFRGPDDKPLIIADKNGLPSELADFFHIRPPQWPLEEKQEDGFPYMNIAKPQDLYTDLMNVSVSQFAGPCSFGKTKQLTAADQFYGRGYSLHTPESGNVRNIEEGRNFQEQWENALAADPDIVFITGWNEWIAQKSAEGYGWIDTFDTEWSRDIEMTKAPCYASANVNDYSMQGYGDCYYLQMAGGIRRYRLGRTSGAAAPEQAEDGGRCFQTIDIYGAPEQWETVSDRYENIAVAKPARDYIGASPLLRYTLPAPENFIREIRIAQDAQALFFYMRTDRPLSGPRPGQTNWMNLWIHIEGCGGPAWETYHFTVNRRFAGPGISLVERPASDGVFSFVSVGRAEYSAAGNVLQMKIEKSVLGIGKEPFVLHFKVSDSIIREDDILDYYVSGDAVPPGRLSYVFAGKYREEADCDEI